MTGQRVIALYSSPVYGQALFWLGSASILGIASKTAPLITAVPVRRADWPLF
jgi:hypothetical protein